MDSKVVTHIPRCLHFVLISGERRFGAFYYLSMKTAIDHIKPDIIYFYCDQVPDTIYFKLIKQLLGNNLVIENIPAHIVLCGQFVYAPQHRVDYIRLHKLQERGGIYLDLDILCLKSFDPIIQHMEQNNKEIAMGLERDPSDPHQSLCNAVIICQPNSSFIKEWLTAYDGRWGDPSIPNWFGHSTVIPMELARKYPEKMDMRVNTDFYPFLWYGYPIFKEPGLTYPDSYCCHFFETEARKARLIPETFYRVLKTDNSFRSLFFEYLPMCPDLIDLFFEQPEYSYQKFIEQARHFKTRLSVCSTDQLLLLQDALLIDAPKIIENEVLTALISRKLTPSLIVPRHIAEVLANI